MFIACFFLQQKFLPSNKTFITFICYFYIFFNFKNPIFPLHYFIYSKKVTKNKKIDHKVDNKILKRFCCTRFFLFCFIKVFFFCFFVFLFLYIKRVDKILSWKRRNATKRFVKAIHISLTKKKTESVNMLVINMEIFL